MAELSVVELCTGAGGQAIGLEQAGFEPVICVENDVDACSTLRANRPAWKIHEGDIRTFDGARYRGVDLVAGGVPCQPFSVAGDQLGTADERNLFPEALRIIGEAMPRAVMLENVKGIFGPRFDEFRASVLHVLEGLGYTTEWRIEQAACHGVPQLRPRAVLIATQDNWWTDPFRWPADVIAGTTAGLALYDLMKARDWPGAAHWALERCNKIAPTLVGGSKKHGGPDLGPTRAREAWAKLGVNGSSIAEEAPGPVHPMDHTPRLTVAMGARLQGFPDDWQITGGKTAQWRQVGNAFPPPVARDLGAAIGRALR